jgi:excisionase family DNA binding protein
MTFGDRFYSVAELADVTGYHRDSIYRAIESGALAAAKPRGKWLIAGAAINACLAAGQVVSTTAPRGRGAASPQARATRAATTRRGGSDPRPSFRELARRQRTS